MADAPATEAAPQATPENEAAIRACVRSLYDAARKDELLAPVFDSVIKDWDGHLTMMDDFWSAALLGTERYKRAPFPPHLKLDMSQHHFDRWNELWGTAARASIPGVLGVRAANMGASMAHCWGKAFVSMKARMQKNA